MKVHVFKQFICFDPNDTISFEETQEWDRASALWEEIVTELVETDPEFKLLLLSMMTRCEGLGSQ